MVESPTREEILLPICEINKLISQIGRRICMKMDGGRPSILTPPRIDTFVNTPPNL